MGKNASDELKYEFFKTKKSMVKTNHLAHIDKRQSILLIVKGKNSIIILVWICIIEKKWIIWVIKGKESGISVFITKLHDDMKDEICYCCWFTLLKKAELFSLNTETAPKIKKNNSNNKKKIRQVSFRGGQNKVNFKEIKFYWLSQ